MKRQLPALAIGLLLVAAGSRGAAGGEHLSGNTTLYFTRAYQDGQATGNLTQMHNFTLADDLNDKIKIGGTVNFTQDYAMHSDEHPSTWRLSPYLNAREQAATYDWQLGVQQNQSAGSNTPNRVTREYYSRLGLTLPASMPTFTLTSRFVQNYALSEQLSELGEWEMRTRYAFRSINLRYELNQRTYDDLISASTTKTLNSTLGADYNYTLAFRLLPETQLGLGYDHSTWRTADENVITGVEAVTNRRLNNFYGSFTSRPLPNLRVDDSGKYQLGEARTATDKTVERHFENSLSLAGELLESCHVGAAFDHRNRNIAAGDENLKNTYNANLTMQPIPTLNYNFDVNREDRFETPDAVRVYRGYGFNNALALELYRNIVQGTLQYADSRYEDLNRNTFSRSRYFRPTLHYRLNDETTFDLSNQYNWSRDGMAVPESLARDHSLVATTDFPRLPLRLVGTLQFADNPGREQFDEILEARWHWADLLVVTGSFRNVLTREGGEKKKPTATWLPSSITSRSS